MTDAERIAHLERELAEERHSREVAAKKTWEFSDQFRAMSWQPIETAPKSDDICKPIKVLVYGIRDGELSGWDDEPTVWKAYWCDGSWYVSGGDYYAAWVRSPTHWMPLPEPPNVSRETIEIARKKS